MVAAAAAAVVVVVENLEGASNFSSSLTSTADPLTIVSVLFCTEEGDNTKMWRFWRFGSVSFRVKLTINLVLQTVLRFSCNSMGVNF